jgi:hypothetical protein
LGPTGGASEQLEEERELLRPLMAQMEIGDEQDRHSSAFKDFVMYINTEGLCQARWSKYDLP